MLENSLVLFRGVTLKGERKLWEAGTLTWEQYEKSQSPQLSLLDAEPTFLGIPRPNRELLDFRTALTIKNVQFFAEKLARSEYFRIALTFPEDILFLDIESTGLSRYYDQITVIGWCLGNEFGFFVKGQDDLRFRSALGGARSVVTFNGSLFDLPFILHEFPELKSPQAHVDLRFLARRVGLSGGQKLIENEIGIRRAKSIEGLSGEFAPVLWHEYVSGDTSALERLLKYNAADISGMVEIFCHVAEALLVQYGFPQANECATRVRQMLAPAMDISNLDFSEYLKPYPSTGRKLLRIEDFVFVDRRPRLRVVGIDLTGSEKRASGWCILDGHEARTTLVSTDEELIARTVIERPHVVSIDSPLSLPDGRIQVEDSDPGRKEFGIMRYSERVLKKRGVNVYPALLPSMQRLTARGIRLAASFRKLGLPVIESYPGAAQDIMRIPRKRKGLEYLEQGLAAFGVSGPYVRGGVSHDELDAITSAIVGLFFWSGWVERLGATPLGEEALFIPDLRVDPTKMRDRLVVGLSGPLGAGKTTGAKYLESLGFHYCRYSQVIEKIMSKRSVAPSRLELQAEGHRINAEYGQRWLGRELLRPIMDHRFIVIDGLRFPEDHAFLTETFASQFVHIHVVAPKDLRKERFEEREGLSADFSRQEKHIVESHVPRLESMAREIVSNLDSLLQYQLALNSVLTKDWRD